MSFIWEHKSKSQKAVKRGDWRQIVRSDWSKKRRKICDNMRGERLRKIVRHGADRIICFLFSDPIPNKIPVPPDPTLRTIYLKRFFPSEAIFKYLSGGRIVSQQSDVPFGRLSQAAMGPVAARVGQKLDPVKDKNCWFFA